MIRNTTLGAATPKRRIAVIEMPRPQRARMGSIGYGNPARDGAVAWTTISDEAPESTGNFMSSVIAKQNLARTTTPGTLTYTPANNTPAGNVAPWNSWLQPNCGASGSSTAATAPAAASADTSVTPSRSPWFIALGLIGALASAKYLFTGSRR